MEKLFEKFIQKLQFISTEFSRSIIHEINWKSRLIGIKGARGIGKTTLLLQYIKLNHSHELEKTLYISLDSIWFSNNSLVDLVENFIKKGGKYLFLDEVHKYPNWSQEIKNIYDDYPDVKIVFTGSSLLEILNTRADLSRRAITYTMQGLSFREYLAIENGIELPILKLEEILKNHVYLSQQILKSIKPFQYLDSYLKMGYYPFYKEEKELFNQRLTEVVNMILEIELPLLRNLEIAYIHKIKQLLVILTESVPFTPNITKISSRIGINRITLLNYLHYLEEAELTINLNTEAGGISKLQKPTKLYLNNTNLMFILQNDSVNTGTLREIFFANQLKYKHTLSLPQFGDFLIDNTYIIEIGGKDKSFKQIEGIENAYVAADDIEFGFGNKIPLWLFGFLY